MSRIMRILILPSALRRRGLTNGILEPQESHCLLFFICKATCCNEWIMRAFVLLQRVCNGDRRSSLHDHLPRYDVTQHRHYDVKIISII
jgi:hypothetical protein